MKKIIFIIIFILFIFSCTEDPFNEAGHHIGYLVSGKIYWMDLKYIDCNGDTIKIDSIKVPWIHNFPVYVKDGFNTYIYAENISVPGKFVVRIFKDEETFRETVACDTDTVAIAFGEI